MNTFSTVHMQAVDKTQKIIQIYFMWGVYSIPSSSCALHRNCGIVQVVLAISVT